MKLSSSQRWAIGAITLTILIACSPPTPPVEPTQPPPTAPTLSTPDAPPATPTSAPAASQTPGFAGAWALVEAECGDRAKTYRLSAYQIDTPGDRTCAVKSISEEHPSGRSMIYNVAASCFAEGHSSEDKLALNFGPSDTFMQFKLNDQKPVELTRCPAP